MAIGDGDGDVVDGDGYLTTLILNLAFSYRPQKFACEKHSFVLLPECWISCKQGSNATRNSTASRRENVLMSQFLARFPTGSAPPLSSMIILWRIIKHIIVSLRLKHLLHIDSLPPSRDYTNPGWKILKPTCLKLLCVEIREHKRGCTTTPVAVPGSYICHLKVSFLQINESFIVIPTMGASQAHLSAFNCCALWPWVYHHHQSYLFHQKVCLSSTHYFSVEWNFSTS